MLFTKSQAALYQFIVKPVLFRFDAETVHDLILAIGKRIGAVSVSRSVAKNLYAYHHSVLEQTIHGIQFTNPIGLAAGFDKNAELTRVLPAVGFGFEEVGSITGRPCTGNQKPRLWRLPEKKSLRVYYGLKNDGADAIRDRLQKESFQFPVGISIAKTNSPDTVDQEKAIADYVHVYQTFSDIGAYDTVNISCPNAFGGQPFNDAESLLALLEALTAIRNEKPMFIKLSPDLSKEELDAIVGVAKKAKVQGFISTNLTKKHNYGEGGLSGKSVSDLSLQQLDYLFTTYGHEFVYISCGGIFTVEDLYQRIRHGASLVQLITGMIYQGPQLIGTLNHGLAQKLKEDGFKNISEAVGIHHRTYA